MVALDDTTEETRFDSFIVLRTSYKTIGSHEIDVGILIPKNLNLEKHPLVVKFHGGGLVNGDCLYAPWISAFWVPFLHRNSAITVLPNYRLTPEASGTEILEDLSDFWDWLLKNRKLDTYLASKDVQLEIDYTKLFVTGDSAGGYMALQSAVQRPEGEIKVVLAQYPMTNVSRRTPDDRPFGVAPPPKTWLDTYIQSMKPGDIRSSSDPTTDQSRKPLSSALNAYQRFEEFFGTGKSLWPVTAIGDAKSWPPTTIFHGRQDSAVAFEDTEVFVEKVMKMFKDTEIRLVARDGDHGFDMETKEDEEEWLKRELQWVESKWLV
ncbi:unnamed protein product [Periconia digitata]|uniref:Alpha/beta hydrolase fold-3 domain-containing protein n=1 Tax=Periconia digitata TaxID=1303443 RepID=A0A9W4XKN0_9PLEO|nr:unnamed protein product [Periconia digitata]